MPVIIVMPKVTQEYINQKKNLIVQSAAICCDKKAVCSVTMQDVIDESGLSQGGIYRFYQNIDDILVDVLKWVSSIPIYDKNKVINNFIEMIKTAATRFWEWIKKKAETFLLEGITGSGKTAFMNLSAIFVQNFLFCLKNISTHTFQFILDFTI